MFHKLVFRKRPRKKVYLKTYLSNTPNMVDQIQIQIHGLKFDQIQIQIQICRICICICICKYKYVFDPSPGHHWCLVHLGWVDMLPTSADAMLLVRLRSEGRELLKFHSDLCTDTLVKIYQGVPSVTNPLENHFCPESTATVNCVW